MLPFRYSARPQNDPIEKKILHGQKGHSGYEKEALVDWQGL
jgi:hypothetical protein